DAPGVGDTADLDGIGRERRRFQARRERGWLAARHALRGGLGRGLLDQALDRGRSLRANALPVGQAVLRDADAFLVVLGDRVVEAQALDERAVAPLALVGHD